MSGDRRSGAEAVCDALEALGVRHVFGMPGTQTVPLYEALRTSRLRTVTNTSELAAAFAAGAYYRASGRLAAVVTIPGPGFTLALTGLAEARADSAALLHIVGAPAEAGGRRDGLQAIDQAAVAEPLVKRVFDVRRADEVGPCLEEAARAALSGEPGPVIVQVAASVWAEETAVPPPSAPARASHPALPEAEVQAALALLGAARRPVIYAGQGAVHAADRVREVAEALGAPVATTPSGRGILPEDHPLALGFDPLRGDVAALNGLLAEADVVLVLGCKLGHNGSAGFELRLPADRTIRVDAEARNLEASYDAGCRVHGDAGAFLERVGAVLAGRAGEEGWSAEEVSRWRERIRAPRESGPEPQVAGAQGQTAAGFFSALRAGLPRDAVLVTDSGLHQILARRYYEVLAPRGLLLPSDYQSMGFGVPAALGAKLADPERPVVAIVGDGGLAMTGLELVTAVRERVPLTVIVFNDGQLNQIRLQQLADYGRAHAVGLGACEFDRLAAALGAGYRGVDDDAEAVVRAVAGGPEVTLVEVAVGDSAIIRRRALGRAAAQGLRRALPARVWGWLKRRLSRPSSA